MCSGGTEFVAVDPAVGDWQPICFSCQEPVESWAEAVVVPAGRTEDDEPDCLVVAHLECPRVAPKGDWRNLIDTHG